MTNMQKKQRQWLRKRGWSVCDNNGGCGTANIFKDPIEFDYFAFDDPGSIVIAMYDESGDYIFTKIKLEELKQIIKLAEIADMELECSREKANK